MKPNSKWPDEMKAELIGRCCRYGEGNKNWGVISREMGIAVTKCRAMYNWLTGETANKPPRPRDPFSIMSADFSTDNLNVRD